ncbi:replication factor RFC1 C terminal domain-containing protein [Lipomyces kononenkoae]|uniref:Replication factor RFC1 C terminal domain-containing protein n=1 Tax=Lipomyces kononenkoae TaxID=34357 RepID=A0ACC3T3C7_LIPKO
MDIRKFFGGSSQPLSSSPQKTKGTLSTAKSPTKRANLKSTLKKSTKSDDDFIDDSGDVEHVSSKSRKRTSREPRISPSKRTKQAKSNDEEPIEVSSYFGSAEVNDVTKSAASTQLSRSGRQPTRKAAAASKTKKKNDDEDSEYGSLSVDDDELEFVLSQSESQPRQDTGKSKSDSRKRGAVAGTDGDVKPATSPLPKKAKPAVTTARHAPGNDDAQRILDNVPTIEPPPTTGEAKKFNFQEYKARQAAVNQPPGGKIELPVGQQNCLAGLTFVFTGILDTLPRDDGVDLVKRYGGRVTGAPSRNTSYIVLGQEAGAKKLETIKKLNIPTINEEGLFKMIRELPANGGSSAAGKAAAAKVAAEEKKIKEMAESFGVATREPLSSPSARGGPARTLLWTDKYAPTSLKDICGNKGLVAKLQDWLSKWDGNLKAGFKKPGPDGSGLYRAVMITGPPGIGKTTSAHLVAKLAGYDIIETNASDARSKNIVAETFAGVLDNTSLMGYFGTKKKDVEASKKKIVLIMDEVDGMSAGDRGGVNQMVTICKTTRIPVILICNDYSLPKMRQFDKVTFTLAFRRPDAAAIRSRILSIAYREGIKIPTPVIDQLVQSSHSDIRQIINLISAFRVSGTEMDYDQGKAMSKAWEKHIVMKPFDIAAQLLGGSLFSANSRSTLNDKLELYFNDHDFTPLMIQENYLRTKPQLARSYAPGAEYNLKSLELLDKASSSMSDGDLCDRIIHGSQQQWSLMPLHGILSTVRPAAYVSGAGAGGERYQFTSWLGQNSKGSKLMRYLQEIQSHARLRISGDRYEVRLQYMSAFFDHLYTPIATNGTEGVSTIIDFMDGYYLTKEDFDAILELGVGPQNGEELWKKIPTATKTAFTRQYNTMDHPVPFIRASAIVDPRKEKAAKKEIPDLEEALDDVMGDDAEEEPEKGKDEEEESIDDLAKDKYIQKPSKVGTKQAKGKATSSRGKKKAK